MELSEEPEHDPGSTVVVSVSLGPVADPWNPLKLQVTETPPGKPKV
jgi:hypothetical protein